MKIAPGNLISTAVKAGLAALNLELIRKKRLSAGTRVRDFLRQNAVTDIEQIALESESVPGMLSRESASCLYMLCVTQMIKGDVVEIGSWQGYSTSFLARAVRDSRNGKLFAIDHFKGNEGTEDWYKVSRTDLSDLRQNFESNMRNLDLWDYVNLLDMSNAEAATQLQDSKVRFLFIDGDHTRKGVECDIALFFPLLVSNAIVVFDDFSDEAWGVVEAVRQQIQQTRPARLVSYPNSLVMALEDAVGSGDG